METALQVFTGNGFSIRATTDNGEIWFVAKDIAEALDYSEASINQVNNLFSHVPTIWAAHKQIMVRSENGVEQTRDVLCVNEQGLYFFLGRSDKPKALPYQMWIAGEVVPSIRKTGNYSSRPNNVTPVDPIAGAKIVFEAAGIKDNQLALALDRVYMTYTGASALEAGQITLTAPTKKQLLTPTEIGSHFGLKAHRVNEILAGMGYQHKIAGRWEVLPPGELYAVMQDTGKSHKHGTPVRQLKWDADILDALEQHINSHC